MDRKFVQCKAEGFTKELREGLWVCGYRGVCKNIVYSKYAIPFCREPLVEKLKKEGKHDGD